MVDTSYGLLNMVFSPVLCGRPGGPVVNFEYYYRWDHGLNPRTQCLLLKWPKIAEALSVSFPSLHGGVFRYRKTRSQVRCGL